MPDSMSFDQIVVKGAAAPQPDSVKAPRERSLLAIASGNIAWIGLIVAGAAAAGVLSHLTVKQIQTQLVLQADQAGIEQLLVQNPAQLTSPDYVETLSELAMELPTADLGSAYAAASRTTELDTSRAYAWAQLAYLETRRASGNVNEASLNALTRSMDACPLCAEDLIAWRFNFVLTNWNAIPDPLRRRAFEQADLLRWVGQNSEFLAEMRVKARLHGIPFDAYRAAVKTPARTWDIDPSAVAKVKQAADPS